MNFKVTPINEMDLASITAMLNENKDRLDLLVQQYPGIIKRWLELLGIEMKAMSTDSINGVVLPIIIEKLKKYPNISFGDRGFASQNDLICSITPHGIQIEEPKSNNSLKIELDYPAQDYINDCILIHEEFGFDFSSSIKDMLYQRFITPIMYGRVVPNPDRKPAVENAFHEYRIFRVYFKGIEVNRTINYSFGSADVPFNLANLNFYYGLSNNSDKTFVDCDVLMENGKPVNIKEQRRLSEVKQSKFTNDILDAFREKGVNMKNRAIFFPGCDINENHAKYDRMARQE